MYFDHFVLVGIFVDGMKQGRFGFGDRVPLSDWELNMGDDAETVRGFLAENSIAFAESQGDAIPHRIMTDGNVELVFDREQRLESMSCQW